MLPEPAAGWFSVAVVVGEFAHYQGWIAWVPVVAPLLAIAAVFRRVPALSVGIAGGLVGLAITAAAFVVDDRLGQWLMIEGPLIGIGLGVVVGAAIGHATSRNSGMVRDGSLLTVGLAMAFGSLGLIIGGFTPAIVHGAPPDMDIDVIVAATIGGSIGWILGAVIGWVRTADASPPREGQRWVLHLMALTIAFFGFVIGASITSARFGPMIDEIEPGDPRLAPTAAIVYAATALAVLTLVAVAERGRLRRDHR